MRLDEYLNSLGINRKHVKAIHTRRKLTGLQSYVEFAQGGSLMLPEWVEAGLKPPMLSTDGTTCDPFVVKTPAQEQAAGIFKGITMDLLPGVTNNPAFETVNGHGLQIAELQEQVKKLTKRLEDAEACDRQQEIGMNQVEQAIRRVNADQKAQDGKIEHVGGLIDRANERIGDNYSDLRKRIDWLNMQPSKMTATTRQLAESAEKAEKILVDSRFETLTKRVMVVEGLLGEMRVSQEKLKFNLIPPVIDAVSRHLDTLSYRDEIDELARFITEIRGNLQKVTESKATATDKALASIRTRIHELETGTVIQKQAAHAGEMLGKLEALTKKMGRYGMIDAFIREAGEKQRAFEAKFAEIEKALERNSNSHHTIYADLKSHEERLDLGNASFKRIDGEIGDLNAKMGILDDAQEFQGSQIEAIGGRVDRITGTQEDR